MKSEFTKGKILLLLGLTGALCFLPSLFFFFCADDFVWIEKSKDLCLTTIPDLVKDYNFTLRFRPVINLVFKFYYHIFFLKPFWYHLFNLVLHILNTFLLYLLISHFSKDFRLNLCIVFIFLTHFIHEESVFWISSVSTLLGAFLYLGSLLMFFNYQDGTRRKSKYFFSIFLFSIALFSREDSFTLPFVILILIYLKSIGWSDFVIKLKKQIGSLCPFLTISILFLILQLFIFQPPFFSKTFTLSPLNWIKNGFYIIGNYLLPARFFFDLSGYRLHDFSLNIFKRSSGSIFWGVILLFLAFIFVFLIMRLFQRRNFLFNFGILFSVATALPYLFLNANGQRFCYLPAIGFSAALLGFLQILFQRKKGDDFTRLYKRLSLVISVAVVFNFFVLYERGYWWWEGGSTARDIMQQAEEVVADIPSQKTLYFVDLPRRIHGSYVFHQGFPEAIKLFYPDFEVEIKQVNQSDLDKIENWEGEYAFKYEDGGLVRLTK